MILRLIPLLNENSFIHQIIRIIRNLILSLKFLPYEKEKNISNFDEEDDENVTIPLSLNYVLYECFPHFTHLMRNLKNIKLYEELIDFYCEISFISDFFTIERIKEISSNFFASLEYFTITFSLKEQVFKVVKKYFQFLLLSGKIILKEMYQRKIENSIGENIKDLKEIELFSSGEEEGEDENILKLREALKEVITSNIKNTLLLIFQKTPNIEEGGFNGKERFSKKNYNYEKYYKMNKYFHLFHSLIRINKKEIEENSSKCNVLSKLIELINSNCFNSFNKWFKQVFKITIKQEDAEEEKEIINNLLKQEQEEDLVFLYNVFFMMKIH